jgi:hypothetical protein
MLQMEIYKYRVNENTSDETNQMCDLGDMQCEAAYEVATKNCKTGLEPKHSVHKDEVVYGRQLGPTSCKQSRVENKHNGTYHYRKSLNTK